MEIIIAHNPIDWNPVFPRAFHANFKAVFGTYPLFEFPNPLRKGGKTLLFGEFDLAIRESCDARNKKCLVNIDTAAAFPYLAH
jgi:hypothetical protein